MEKQKNLYLETQSFEGGKNKIKGEGQKVSSERPNPNQLTSPCVLGCIFPFLLSIIKWKLDFPPEGRKALKRKGLLLIVGMAGKWGEIQHTLIFDDEVGPSPLRKFRGLEGLALHLESSIVWSSDCFNILFLLPNPSHNHSYHSTQIRTEFLLFIKCSRAQGNSQA